MNPDDIIQLIESPTGEPTASALARRQIHRMHNNIVHARRVCRALIGEICTPGPDGTSQLQERHAERMLAESIISCLSDAP